MTAAEAAVRSVLAGVMDPEIPVLSLLDLGVIRAVSVHERAVQVDVTPTYSGCPATQVIKADVAAALRAAGYTPTIRESLTPPWSTDGITPAGHAALQRYGIAPPTPSVACPHCHGRQVECVSEFGSTPCKALYRCRECLEPFDRFKCL